MRCQKALSDLQLSRRCIKFGGILGIILAILLSGTGRRFRAGAEVVPSPSGSAYRAWTDSHCGSCHKINPLFSHPIDIVPTMTIPAHLPLDEGRITCITCHEDDAAAHAGARSDGSSLLRGSRSGSAFCAQCHTSTNSSRQSQHPMAIGSAHLTRGSGPDPAGTFGFGRFDAQTIQCLSCHDGLMAADAGASVTRFNDLPGDHPVGVSMRYNPSDASGEDAMRSPALLDRRIRLFNDTVGCGSCHSPYSTEKNLLVMSNQGSKLCLSCHMP